MPRAETRSNLSWRYALHSLDLAPRTEHCKGVVAANFWKGWVVCVARPYATYPGRNWGTGTGQTGERRDVS
jgi:hypothetical protein